MESRVETVEVTADSRKIDSKLTSGVLSGIEPKLLHSRNESCAVQTDALGSSAAPPNSAFSFGERSHDLLALLLRILVGDPLFFTQGGVDCFLYNPLDVVGRRGGSRSDGFDSRLLQLVERCFELLPPAQNNGALDEVLQFADVPRPGPRR